MNTDDLVKMLSTNLEPVDWRAASRAILISAALGGVAAFAAMILLLGVRTDVSGLRAWMFVVLKVVFAGTILAAALMYLMRIARPGGERRVSAALTILPFAVALVVAAVSLALTPMSNWRVAIVGEHSLLCLVCIPLNALLPFAAIVLAIRQFAPTNLRLAGALAGLAAGAISAFVYALHCTDDSLAFVSIWYGLTIALCTLVGALLGPPLLRW